MSKYFDTKPGSLEEAVSAAQQAAIAISKKEKGEKPKNEDQGQFSFVASQAKKNGEKKFNFAGKEFEVEKVECPKCEGKGCDHCEGKGYHEEGFSLDEQMRVFRVSSNKLQGNVHAKDEKEAEKIFRKKGAKGKITITDRGPAKGQPRLVNDFEPVGETNKNDKSDDGDGLDAVQPDAVKKKFKDRKDKDIDNDGDVDSSDKFLHKRRKAVSKAMKGESVIRNVAETIMQMWVDEAKKNESQDMEQDKDGDGMDDDGKAKKTKEKTDSGKEMTPVETSVKMPKVKNEKNKV
jgi:hypothetical protein